MTYWWMAHRLMAYSHDNFYMIYKILYATWLSLALLYSAPTAALTLQEAQGMAIGDSDARIQALNKASVQADDKTAAFIQALADDAVKTAGDKIFVMRDGKAIDPISGQTVALPDGVEDVISNNRMRGELDAAQAVLKLFSKDDKLRGQAIASLLKDPDESKLALLDKALAAESKADLIALLGLAQAAARLGSPDKTKRLEAAKALAESKDPATQLLLNERVKLESDAEVKAQLQASLAKIKSSLGLGETLGVVFTGISLGSILLLAALGLAITYGLMGVINMAHGELIMVGAYATYMVQSLFRNYAPGAFDWYLIAAIPVAFMASALVGAAMERSVIRFLYGRPLETLLATWGVSLILMQSVRTVFGAQNVGVENPSWMSGSFALLPNLSLPYNRLMIVLFAVLVLVGVALVISKTRLGLFVRGVTQNRPIAACMGVNTARIDTYAFSLGSGIAGLAGCALSQVGNVGPDLGQNYIVDSFMVVVLGGVGQLVGTVYAALGLGLLNKVLEGWSGAVLAKIAVLVFIIVFIQKRPQGIFALKGRSAEA
jgi:urea transport system permease protein